MYVRIVKLSFMNDFSKEAASNLLVQIGKTKGFAEGMLLRMSVDVSDTQRYSMTVWPSKKIEEKTWKLFGEEVLKKLKETGARVEVSKGEINEINISKDLDLGNLVIN
jgi:DNA recombination-dependent growth factor C